MRRRALGVEVDSFTLAETVQQVRTFLSDPVSDPGLGCRYIVTPNLDHAVLFQRSPEFREAYRAAALVLPDGMPLVWATRMVGAPLPERVPGSDLVPAIFQDASARARTAAAGPLKVYLLGAAPGVAERAAGAIERRFPAVKVVGMHSPPLGFELQPDLNQDIVDRVNAAAPELLVVGLGAPKQELWLYRNAPKLRVPVAIAAGATIDFLAGHRRRAPRLFQVTGTEWLYRALGEPRRLLPRYARDAWHLPGLLLGDIRAAREARTGSGTRV